MDSNFHGKLDLKSFFEDRREDFEKDLLEETVTVRDKIEEILRVGNIDLLTNAHRLVMYVVEERKGELMAFAKAEGIAWAAHSLTLAFKLEWVQGIRRTLWKYIRFFNDQNPGLFSPTVFFEVEHQFNDHVDQFLNGFFLSYSEYKDKLIEDQRILVDNLSVPIIPISSTICILPLIGTLDLKRMNLIEEKVLNEINRLRINTLVIDLSGIAEVESEVIAHLLKIIDGTQMMGCKSVITGTRPEVVMEMIQLGLAFDKADTKGTLQQALNEYFHMNVSPV
ncbi:STAS domain-containing protein [Bacillus massiliglaciei]|uniref:STAS domain-containing protein n=1 Tax=Bacillus massiliglaciei TaxID=1816693 RepID=UPI000ACFE712|nr:STAS domain-containing protein [Bacillus massiliglaciei]